MTAKEITQETFKRFNARITKEQYKFIKEKSDKERVSQSEAHRIMLDDFISKAKKK